MSFRYLHAVLKKNAIVTEYNRILLVEALRATSEILIWGDQNDPSVFEFFLEKGMLAHFLYLMRQNCGRFICIQLLQTLNILFENIRSEVALYYLLSNNHVNCIINHRFDFSDEEILAYYISFLKTLSIKLNGKTINFFFNESTNEFPLYSEAIKFFNHSERMIRIAVRTLTLNVFRGFYMKLEKLLDSIAEHLDHFHYLNDILSLNMASINEMLCDRLFSDLFLPLYIASLRRDPEVKHLLDFCLLFLTASCSYRIDSLIVVDGYLFYSLWRSMRARGHPLKSAQRRTCIRECIFNL
ncbi:unnamed protein product [Soboliphyme baturini]|uniref:FPL domain-containing protein n=1 Tax=Soboliphyme baturini TaxID=241478 RepID=A0A183IKV4_9BILA|nr:unnamed protein product [Soboliphyme baturini]